MRILINGLSARLGGGQTYLRNILTNFPSNYDAEVFLLCDPALKIDNYKNKVHLIKIGGLENPFFRAIWEAFFLNKMIAKFKIDILFCPGGMLPIFNTTKNLKTVVTFQNMLPFDSFQCNRYPLGYRRLRHWLLKKIFIGSMKKANLVIFISQFAKNYISSVFDGIVFHNSVVIPHGVSNFFFPVKNKLIGSPLSKPYFLYVSYIDIYKSQLEILEAYHVLLKSMNIDIDLIFVGAEYKPYGDLLRSKIREYCLDEKVFILGNLPHEDLPAFYQNSVFNIFASCTENCPNILLEMMASGKPALVSFFEPMPEFSLDTVVYFNPENLDDIVKKWKFTLLHLNFLKRKANKSLSIASKFTWRSTGRNTWKAIYNLK